MGKRGPKPKYERILNNQEGAPMFSTRLDPPIYHHIKAQPEGPRAYVERLVNDDMNRAGISQPRNTQENSPIETEPI